MTSLRILHALPRTAAALLWLLLISHCNTETATAPNTPPEAAVGGSDPTVKSATPSASPRDTSISVLIQGSGFDHGSSAVWALKGDTAFASTRIRVTSTTFVSSKELIADLAISADAPLERYDVQVLTSNGKKGIGIERFEVTEGITTLPALSGFGDGGTAINDAGTIVGYAIDEKEHRYAARWQKRGRVWTIDKLPAAINDAKHATAYDISDNGTIVGIRYNDIHAEGEDQDLHATVWPNSGGLTDLGPGAALGVSSNGTVVGTRLDFNNSGPFNSQGVVWTRVSDHTWEKGRLLPRLRNGHGTLAQGINAGGNVIVGVAADATDLQHAVKWRLIGSQWQTPSLLEGGEGSIVGTLINAAGDVAGAGFPCEGCPPQAMFWPAEGGRLDLAALGVYQSQPLVGLSNAGDVVGIATTLDFRQYAFLWRPKAHTVIDLGNLLGDEGSEARDINNHRQVVGASFGPRGTRAILWRVR
jgi:probable HAF family extracellular repeat protein